LALTASAYADTAGQPISVTVQNGLINIVSAPLPPPSDLVTTSISKTQIYLTWQDNSSTESGFHIERSPDENTNWTEIAVTGADVTSYTDSDLSCSTEYYYRVRACSDGTVQCSAYSNVASATTHACFQVYLPVMLRNAP
jgi:hypothetical protein